MNVVCNVGLFCYVFRLQFRVNGRSSSPTSLGSYGVEDDDGFLTHDHDSDTGVVSIHPNIIEYYLICQNIANLLQGEVLEILRCVHRSEINFYPSWCLMIMQTHITECLTCYLSVPYSYNSHNFLWKSCKGHPIKCLSR